MRDLSWLIPQNKDFNISICKSNLKENTFTNIPQQMLSFGFESKVFSNEIKQNEWVLMIDKPNAIPSNREILDLNLSVNKQSEEDQSINLLITSNMELEKEIQLDEYTLTKIKYKPWEPEYDLYTK